MLLETLKSEAIQRGYLKPEEEIDLRKAFFLVRDMPYTRADWDWSPDYDVDRFFEE